MATEKQSRIFDTPGEQAFEIETGGEVIKPFLNAIAVLNDEMRLHVESDGLRVQATDPANVGMVYVKLHADAFEQYEIEGEREYGLSVGQTQSLVRRARMDHDDVLHLDGYENELHATVRRDTDEVTLVFEDQLRTIDPNSIRHDADLNVDPTEYDDLEYQFVTLGDEVFLDGFNHIVSEYNYTYIGTRDGDLCVWPLQDDDIELASGVRYEGVADGPEERGKYSTDYLSDMLAGVNKAKVDEVTVGYGDNIPLYLESERQLDGEEAMKLTYALAPRIGSGDEA